MVMTWMTWMTGRRPRYAWCLLSGVGATTVAQRVCDVHATAAASAPSAERGGTREPVGPPQRADRPETDIYFGYMINNSMIIYCRSLRVGAVKLNHPILNNRW